MLFEAGWLYTCWVTSSLPATHRVWHNAAPPYCRRRARQLACGVWRVTHFVREQHCGYRGNLFNFIECRQCINCGLVDNMHYPCCAVKVNKAAVYRDLRDHLKSESSHDKDFTLSR